jgi:hypothetical protein
MKFGPNMIARGERHGRKKASAPKSSWWRPRPELNRRCNILFFLANRLAKYLCTRDRTRSLNALGIADRESPA